MSTGPSIGRIEVFYSLQNDYCFFLLDRLIGLQNRGVAVEIVPLLGGVLRAPERFMGRDGLERAYFQTDTARSAAFLGLAYAYPDPSPIAFKAGSIWVAEAEQPRNERLNRLFVGAVLQGRGMAFLDHVARMIWDGTTVGWDRGDHLARAMAAAGLDLDQTLAQTPWESATRVLDKNAQRMEAAGHWGVPLMVLEGEPFYGQDRFDQLLWRLREKGILDD